MLLTWEANTPNFCFNLFTWTHTWKSLFHITVSSDNDWFFRGTCLSDLMITQTSWNGGFFHLFECGRYSSRDRAAWPQISWDLSDVDRRLLRAWRSSVWFAPKWTWVWDLAALYKAPRVSWKQTQLGPLVRLFPPLGPAGPIRLGRKMTTRQRRVPAPTGAAEETRPTSPFCA